MFASQWYNSHGFKSYTFAIIYNLFALLQYLKAVSDFPEKLRQAMHEKRCSSADIARATGINPSVLSRYLSGANKPSSDNILVISQYMNVSPEWLLSSSDVPESLKKNQAISSATDPLLKIIEVQEELINNLQKQVKEWEDWKASSKDRHAKGRKKTKNPTKPNKQKVGFMKKHKKPKK